MLHYNTDTSRSCIPNSIIIIFVPLVFFIGIILGYLDVISLKIELHTIIIITFIFITFLFFVKHNANYVACHIKNSSKNMEESLLSQLKLNSLTISGQTKSTLDIKSFISQYYQEIRNNNFANVAPSVFPMLGILGTFIIIAISMPDFTAKDIDALDKDISILLSGIGTAFYASIYGILLSLIWTFFEKRGSSKIDKYIINIEKLYHLQIWTKSELIKHKHTQTELKDNQIVHTLKDIFNIDFIKKLNSQHTQSFSNIINEVNKSFSDIANDINSTSTELRLSLDKIHNRQENINAINLISQNIQGFNESAQTLQNTLKLFDRTVEHTFNNIDKEVGLVVEKLGTFSHTITNKSDEILNKISLDEQNKK